MKFGKVYKPELIDFSMPKDHLDTTVLLFKYKNGTSLNIYVACAKWNRQDLKHFYPRSNKDELSYYLS